MLWDALFLFVPAYFVVAIIATAFDSMQYFLDHGRQTTQPAVLAVFQYSWRGFRVHLIVVISLLLFALSMTHLWESGDSNRWSSAGHHRESLIYFEECLKISDFYEREIPSDYGDAELIRHYLDQALAQVMDFQIRVPEGLSGSQSLSAYERMYIHGLWEMYGGIIESDTIRYQSGDALLREWHDWLDWNRRTDSNVLKGS